MRSSSTRTVKQFDDRAEVLNNRIWLNNQPQYEANGEEYATPDKETATKTLEDAGYAKGSDGIYAKDGQKLVVPHLRPPAATSCVRTPRR